MIVTMVLVKKVTISINAESMDDAMAEIQSSDECMFGGWEIERASVFESQPVNASHVVSCGEIIPIKECK